MNQRQSRIESIVEATVNVVIGLVISMSCNMFAIPAIFSVQITAKQNIAMAVFYTAVSLVRQYVLRRYFNRAIGKFDKRLSAFIRKRFLHGR